MTRFAIREAAPGDADGIAGTQKRSWQTSYRGILPDAVLDRLDFRSRESRRQLLASPAKAGGAAAPEGTRRSIDRGMYSLVAYDLSHRDIVGFCDAGPSRRIVADLTTRACEIYAIYIEHHAKRHGLGREMFEHVVARYRAIGYGALVIWVLDNNVFARRFYEALGGKAGPRVRSTVDGFGVVEVAYVWPKLSAVQI